MKNLIKFNQINGENRNLVGSKAFKLAKLAQENIQIADFYVIPTHIFQKIITRKKIQKLINDLILHQLGNSGKNNCQLTEFLNKINTEIDKFDFSQALSKEILQGFKSLKTKKVAVRSSASCEDQVNSSFAGQFTSYLSVPQDQVLSAVKKCFQSVFNQQVLMYCFYHKVDFSLIKMAVIIQKMIKAEKGGVIFTKDVFQNGNRVIIESARGLGEKVVSGLTNSEKIVFSKKTGKMIEGVIGFNKAVLSIQEAKKLFNLALKIEKIFGQPQDIEWAIEKDQIYILQTRPITS